MSVDTPQSRLDTFLKTYPSIKYVRLVVTPYCGIQILKTIPIYHALQSAAESNVLVPGTEVPPADGQAIAPADARGVVHGSLNFPSALNACITEIGGLDFGGVEPGDDCMQIDWTTLKPILSDPTCAYVACSLYNSMPGSYGYDSDTRVLLRQVEERAKTERDLAFLIGHEVEFVLFDTADLTTPLVDPTACGYANQFGFRGMNILQEIVDGLEHAGVRVWSFHPEQASGGQFEFQLSPATPLDSCDNLEFAIHTIRSVASKNNCIATISAVPFGGAANGRHFHISHTHPEFNDHFRAGIMYRLPSLSAILMGSVEGWKKRDKVTGGAMCWWGRNKFAPMNNKSAGRYEVRTADCHFAVHLQIAAILLAGMDGIEHKRKVSQKEEMPTEDTIKYIFASPDSTIRAELQQKYALDVKMPKDLGEGIEKYEQDIEWWIRGLNEHAAKSILRVIKRRWADRLKHSPDEMRKKLMRIL